MVVQNSLLPVTSGKMLSVHQYKMLCLAIRDNRHICLKTHAFEIRLMTSDAVIQFVHKHMGLVPGWGGAARLVRIVGSQNALQLLAGAKKVDPDFGKHIGLVDGVLPTVAGNFLVDTEQWLSQFTKGSAPVIRAMKKVVLCGRELSLDDALTTERRVFGTVWGGPANLEALAFKTKHK